MESHFGCDPDCFDCERNAIIVFCQFTFSSPTRRLPKRRAIPGPTIPFNHKEMWDGEIVFPKSGR